MTGEGRGVTKEASQRRCSLRAHLPGERLEFPGRGTPGERQPGENSLVG